MKPTSLVKGGFKNVYPLTKWFFIPLLILLVTIVSCRNNDEDTDSDNQDLVGLWQPYKLTQRANLTTGPYNQTTEFTICQQKSRITFSPSNVGNAKTYVDNNGSCDVQDDANFTYEYNSNSKALIIKNLDGSTQSGTVISLTPFDLVYELSGTYEFEGESNVDVKSTFYLRRTKD